MSLSEAIHALRRAVPVPLVPSAEILREPPKALPDKAVPSVPWVPPEKSTIQARNESGQAASLLEGWQDDEGQNGEVSNPSIPGNQGNPVQPLTEQQLVQAVTEAARQFGLEPALLWSFLCIDDFEAIRTGRPDELRALWAFAELRSLSGDTTKARRGLPFPGAVHTAEGAQRVRCGDCRHFQPDRVGDGTGIGRCGRGIEPAGGLMYPGVERGCGGFSRI